MKRFLLCLSLGCMVCLIGVQNGYSSEYAWQNYFLGGWQKYYGTSAHQEAARDICRVSGSETSGYVVVGHRLDLNTGASAAYVSRIDYNGNVVWTRTYRGPYNNKDCVAYAVTNAHNGGFVVTGYIDNNGNEDIFVLKYSSGGSLSWQKTGVGGSAYRCAHDIKQTSDYCYALAGVSDDGRMAFLKIRSNGSFQWGKTITTNTDGPGKETVSSIGYSVVQIGSEYHLCGQAEMANGGDYQLMYVMLEETGYILHSKTHGGGYVDCGYEIIENENYGWPMIAGRYGLSDADSDYWVALIEDGVPVGSKHWGHTDQAEELFSIEQDPYGDFVVAGRVDMDGWGRYNVYLAKLYSNYEIKSEYYYGGSSNAGGFGVKSTGTITSIGIATVAWPGQYGNGDIYVIRHD
ncbi:MAG: hypothetical protein EHM45_11710 [Desulfobacteraceae bacterium]|nr:MAG: hypothetical protein EHM45_11710 [Desulfobacteraceae bacterium]